MDAVMEVCVANRAFWGSRKLEKREGASSSQQIWPVPYHSAGLGECGLDLNHHYPPQLGALVLAISTQLFLEALT